MADERTEVPNQDLEDAIQSATMAADGAVMFGRPFATPAEETAAGVRAAILCLLGNDIITLNPRDAWPKWIALDPPYTTAPSGSRVRNI